MSNTYYKATHSSGFVHLRASGSGRLYSHAVVGAGPTVANFSARADLGRAELAKQLQWDKTRELVPAVAIEKAEYNALLKASKLKHTIVFDGKKVTTTQDVGHAPYVAAVGVAADAYTTEWPLTPEHHESWWKSYPNGIAKTENRAWSRVEWFTDLEEAQASAGGKDLRGRDTHTVGVKGVRLVDLFVL